MRFPDDRFRLALLAWLLIVEIGFLRGALAAAEEPAPALTEVERGKLEMDAVNLRVKADALYRDGRLDEAIERMRQSLAAYRKLYPGGHPDLASTLYILGGLLQEQGQLREAESALREALTLRRKLNPDGGPEVVATLNLLGRLLEDAGDYHEAEAALRDGVAVSRKLYPEDKYPDGHPNLAASLTNLASALYADGRYEEAEDYCRQALAAKRKLYPSEKFPDGHPVVAGSLRDLALVLMGRGEYGEAETLLRDSLAMYQKLYPEDRYPDGRPNLALAFHNLAALLRSREQNREAEKYFREAVAAYRKLYPREKFPHGHPNLANELRVLGVMLDERREHGEAEQCFRDALAMYRDRFPAERFPDGHPQVAQSLTDLGVVLRERGEYEESERMLRAALDMRRRLYPPDKFPEGHALIAESLRQLSWLLDAGEKYKEGERCAREALAMDRKLYPADKFPQGQAEVGEILGNLGVVLQHLKQYDEAERCYREELELGRKLAPVEKVPDGNNDLATTLANLASLLNERGDYQAAEPYYREALAMQRKLFTPERCPDGHPNLAWSLNDLGDCLLRQKEYDKAADVLGEAMTMYDRLTVAYADVVSEAEALNFRASLPAVRDPFLAATSRRPAEKTGDDYYALLWRGKATLARILERRRRLLHAASPAARAKAAELAEARADLAGLVLLPAAPGDALRGERLVETAARKERLERELARLLPDAVDAPPSPADLAGRLAPDAAFVDLYRYRVFDSRTSQWDGGHYAAFVLRKGRPARRVELGEADVSEKDLREWRAAIIAGVASDAGGRLRKRLWEPLSDSLAGVGTVYLCPDGPLAALPWAALPGDRPGRVLLENYTFLLAPNGPFLLDQLGRPPDGDRGPGALLAVGGVRYDRPDAPADKAGQPWAPLPGTQKERSRVVEQAKELPSGPEIVERFGADADVANLLNDLPRARWAHLATHGFFAAPDSEERDLLFVGADFQLGAKGERVGAAARNPLTQCGLVLAGANQPTAKDAGVLSGEAVAGLDLSAMDLAVLSACETGLGEATAGEGVFGLQRAFHIAGARNVVGGLWKVDDVATAALMNLFYYHLWEKGEPPLYALRHAQLELYRNPGRLAALAEGERGAHWKATVRETAAAPADDDAARDTAEIRLWAPFVLSGSGR